jgi:hypothetical protein
MRKHHGFVAFWQRTSLFISQTLKPQPIKTVKSFIKLALFLFLLAGTGRQLFGQGNLVVNGSFESGFGGWLGTYGYLIAPDIALHGRNVGVIVDVSHSSTGEPIYQYLPTVPGISYTFRFHFLSGYGRVGEFPSPGNAPVSVAWGDEHLGTFSNPSTSVWQPHEFHVTAVATSTRIAFHSGDTHWQLVDNIQVVPIPEPGLVPFFVVGIAALGIRYCRNAANNSPTTDQLNRWS